MDGSSAAVGLPDALGAKIWIITEAADDQGKRAATTALLPSEVLTCLSTVKSP